MYIPLSKLLSWPRPNRINPETRGLAVHTVSAILLFLATSAVLGRIYSRIFIRRWFGPDDALVVIALFLTAGVTTCVALGHAEYDWDKHLWDVRRDKAVPASQLFYATRILWSLATSTVRLSVLCLFYRLMRHSGSRRCMWVLHAMTGLTLSLLIVYVVIGVAPCVPINAYWAFPPNRNAQCIDERAFMISVAIINTASEFFLAVLPVFAVFHLQVDKQQRWNVIFMLSLGFLVTIAGCFRTYYVWQAYESWDLTWDAQPQWICSEVEIDVALICACVPALRPLIARIRARWTGEPINPKQEPTLLDSRINSKTDLKTDISRYTDRPSALTYEPDVYVPAWYPLTKLVDLEGIRNDKFGYSVSICGPKQEKPPPKKLRSKVQTLLSGNGNGNGNGSKLNSQRSLTISSQTEQVQQEQEQQKPQEPEINRDVLVVEPTSVTTEEFRTTRPGQYEITHTTCVKLSESFREEGRDSAYTKPGRIASLRPTSNAATSPSIDVEMSPMAAAPPSRRGNWTPFNPLTMGSGPSEASGSRSTSPTTRSPSEPVATLQNQDDKIEPVPNETSLDRPTRPEKTLLTKPHTAIYRP